MCITFIHFIYILNQYTLEGLKIMQKEELNELLTKAKDLLKDETTKIAYETWIRDLEIESADNNNIVLIANNAFQKESIISRYHDLIKNTFNYLTNRNCEITVLLKDDIGYQITFAILHPHFLHYHSKQRKNEPRKEITDFVRNLLIH